MLCEASRAELTGSARLAVFEAFASLSNSASEELIRQSILHGTAGLLCHHLLSCGAESLEEDMVAACRAYTESCQASFAEGLANLQQLLESLSAAGVAAVPYKGPALALRIYPTPGLRRFDDLDLLIRPSQREAALTVLAAQGYSRRVTPKILPAVRRRLHYHRFGQDTLVSPNRLPIEPHWALAPRTFSVAIDVEALLARAVRIPLPGAPTFLGLTPEDVVLTAALHGARHGWSRLVWITDIAAACAAWPSLDAAALLARAGACGCRRMVLLAVLLARDLLQAPLPALLAQEADADSVALSLAQQIRRRLAIPPGEDTTNASSSAAFRWRLRERPADRVRYGMRALLAAQVRNFSRVVLPPHPAVRTRLARIGKRSRA